jgi:chorismate synthase
MQQKTPGNPKSTQRKEEDEVEILSGVLKVNLMHTHVLSIRQRSKK